MGTLRVGTDGEVYPLVYCCLDRSEAFRIERRPVKLTDGVLYSHPIGPVKKGIDAE